jgi:hypothetical protein
MIKRALLSTLLTFPLLSTIAIAEEQVSTLMWSKMKADGQLDTGEVVPASKGSGTNSEEELFIANETTMPLTVRLATIEPTGITRHFYKVRGEIRYEGVQQSGYLEMWNQFADGSRYFSRTLGGSGPMGTIHGTSTARDFILPFQSDAQIGPPLRLEINLVLPAQGKVWIGPLHVSEFTESEWDAATTANGAWWGNSTASWLGGILGALLGILGAIVGMLSGAGRGKNVCMAICWLTVAFVGVCLLCGLFAVVQLQPYVVYFPLLLIGILGTTIMGSILPTTRKRFADVELRRMESMDASVS